LWFQFSKKWKITRNSEIKPVTGFHRKKQMIHWTFAQNNYREIQSLLNETTNWFSGEELVEFRRIAVPKRSMEWLFSRLTVKKLVSGTLGEMHPSYVCVRKESSGLPYIEIAGQGRLGWLSLSHSHQGVLAAFSADGSLRFGVDLERLETRSAELRNDFFTPAEDAWVARLPESDQALAANLVWSAKEAYLKAIGKGLQLDTRRVEIQACDLNENIDWRDLNFTVDGAADPALRLIYRAEAQYALTLCLPPGAALHRLA
jgi:4'-phosphopantetheinyl transferase